MIAHDLPLLNACLNAAAGFCLLGGRRAIKRTKRRDVHRRWMVAALVFSSLFLVSYLAHHYLHGSTRYTGTGFSRILYFSILVTHVPLAGLVVPFALGAVWQAIHGRFDRHVRMVRWLWPVWMYVSVTGILIYLMLYVF